MCNLSISTYFSMSYKKKKKKFPYLYADENNLDHISHPQVISKSLENTDSKNIWHLKNAVCSVPKYKLQKTMQSFIAEVRWIRSWKLAKQTKILWQKPCWLVLVSPLPWDHSCGGLPRPWPKRLPRSYWFRRPENKIWHCRNNYRKETSSCKTV